LRWFWHNASTYLSLDAIDVNRLSPDSLFFCRGGYFRDDWLESFPEIFFSDFIDEIGGISALNSFRMWLTARSSRIFCEEFSIISLAALINLFLSLDFDDDLGIEFFGSFYSFFSQLSFILKSPLMKILMEDNPKIYSNFQILITKIVVTSFKKINENDSW
jgi:hypothetical protein